MLQKGESGALGVAVLMHVGLFALLLLQPLPREVLEKPPEQRMTVNLATEVGLESTAPDPVPESRAPQAPVIADSPGAAEPEPAEFAPAEPEVVTPLPPPKVVRPRPSPTPKPKAQPKPKPKPKPKSANQSKKSPPAKKPSSRSANKKQDTSKTSDSKKTGGGSRIGKDFLGGAGSSESSNETRVPASKIGSGVKNSLFGSVTRQIKPHWNPPSGPEVEKIVTKVRFRLQPDGSLSGSPSVVSQSGVNATNRAQAKRHGENAVRAVRLAAPFKGLPDQYYNAWKTATITFDWKL